MSEPAADGYAFDSESESGARDFVAAHLCARLAAHAADSGQDWIGLAAASGLVDRLASEPPPSPDAFTAPALIRRWRWVVRTEDLKMFDTALDTLLSVVPVGVAMAAATPVAFPLAAAVGAVVHVLKLLRRARAMGTTLDARAWAVVAALHVEGEMPFDKLLHLLRARDPSWSSDELTATLGRLKAYPAAGGSSLALAAADGDRWRLTGI